MGTPPPNRQSLFVSSPEDEEPQRTSTSRAPWDDLMRRLSPRHASLSLPMPGSNNTTGRQQPRGDRQRSSWQDPFLTTRRPQQEHLPSPSAFFPGGGDVLEDFDFDSYLDPGSLAASTPNSRRTPIRTRESSIVDLTETSPVTMPTTSNKRRLSSTESESRTPKRKKNTGISLDGAKDGDKEGKPDDKVEELDLIDAEDDTSYAEVMRKRQEDLIKQQRQAELDKPVRLATTQCVICLDQPDDLAITHCGHMFCSMCLHGALNAGTGKRSCPVCRTTIGAPKKDGKQPRTGVFHLAMKLMTKKQGKKPALR
ncbi:hypothetical protein V495_04974 [Pseudogymnoascus sp. VKM F-4514 (FW-929)]|nr:hypothetical protein V495_04974 [Pseudogymnoascus sp. VKM F-4514 (FW-929)]KFY59814.1 hypothetical protein V497_04073 [Pseudogymnoascus sp. VKM F-4516 (FW-969)]